VGTGAGNRLRQLAAAQGVELEDVVEPIRESLALRRIPTDADVANVIVFFCSDLAKGVTGETLHVDGGQHPVIH